MKIKLRKKYIKELQTTKHTLPKDFTPELAGGYNPHTAKHCDYTEPSAQGMTHCVAFTCGFQFESGCGVII